MVQLSCGRKVCRTCFQRGFDDALVCSFCEKRSRTEDELAALDESQVVPGRWKRFVGGTLTVFGVTIAAYAWSRRSYTS